MSQELAAINAKLDRILALITPPQPLKPLTVTAFAKRVGLSRWTIARKIRFGELLSKQGRIPPSELKKFGV
jgi:hypothetical protein